MVLVDAGSLRGEDRLVPADDLHYGKLNLSDVPNTDFGNN